MRTDTDAGTGTGHTAHPPIRACHYPTQQTPTPQSDVWSLGVLLYQCCTLRLPFEANNPYLLMTKIIKVSGWWGRNAKREREEVTCLLPCLS